MLIELCKMNKLKNDDVAKVIIYYLIVIKLFIVQ